MTERYDVIVMEVISGVESMLSFVIRLYLSGLGAVTRKKIDSLVSTTLSD
jgi:hypothetical protein